MATLKSPCLKCKIHLDGNSKIKNSSCEKCIDRVEYDMKISNRILDYNYHPDDELKLFTNLYGVEINCSAIVNTTKISEMTLLTE